MKSLTVPYLGAALTLIGLWFFFLFVPLHKQEASLTDQTREAQQQLNDFKKIMYELPQFVDAFENLKEQKAVLASKLYSKTDILRLFDKLNLQAKKENLVVAEISPSVEELLSLNSILPDSTQPQFLNIKLRLKGDYISFGRFINRVEQSDYFRGINDCQVEGTKDGRGDIRLQLGFKALLGSFTERT